MNVAAEAPHTGSYSAQIVAAVCVLSEADAQACNGSELVLTSMTVGPSDRSKTAQCCCKVTRGCEIAWSVAAAVQLDYLQSDSAARRFRLKTAAAQQFAESKTDLDARRLLAAAVSALLEMSVDIFRTGPEVQRIDERQQRHWRLARAVTSKD
mmetsp:Transcript_25968/g.46911  ORF Transcript_25968/g.46911 Transcript_25968/m.46911 type:complete len:153 (-) Transcript_25968:2509-2967(-)